MFTDALTANGKICYTYVYGRLKLKHGVRHRGILQFCTLGSDFPFRACFPSPPLSLMSWHDGWYLLLDRLAPISNVLSVPDCVRRGFRFPPLQRAVICRFGSRINSSSGSFDRLRHRDRRYSKGRWNDTPMYYSSFNNILSKLPAYQYNTCIISVRILTVSMYPISTVAHILVSLGESSKTH